MFSINEVHGEPVGKGRPKFSKVGGFVKTYTPDKTAIYENLIKVEYQRQCGDFKFEADDQLDVRIIAYHGIPKYPSNNFSISSYLLAASLFLQLGPVNCMG